MLALMQQPRHAVHAVLLLVLREFSIWVERPEAMGQSRIKIDFCADAALFTENLLIYETFVSKRVHAADLEVGRRKTLLAGLEENR